MTVYIRFYHNSGMAKKVLREAEKEWTNQRPNEKSPFYLQGAGNGRVALSSSVQWGWTDWDKFADDMEARIASHNQGVRQ